jgi:hypothetical protein
MRTACLLALALIVATPVSGQAPVYQRMRTDARHPDSRPGYHHSRRGGFDPHAYGNFYGGYFAPPLVVGSYYQRPYPHHFDYYRYRWGGAAVGEPTPLAPQVEMMPVAECPCLTGASSVEVPSPAE